MRRILGVLVSVGAVFWTVPSGAQEIVAPLDPCTVVPSLQYCSMEAGDLTAAAALERIDTEFDNIQAREARQKRPPRPGAPSSPNEAARKFALDSVGYAALSSDHPVYVRLRDRALSLVEGAETWDGPSYVAARQFGQIAHQAGDRPAAFDTIRLRVTAIRGRGSDDPWFRSHRDLVEHITHREAWFQTAKDAALFGDYETALKILDEGHAAHPPGISRANLEVAQIHLTSGKHRYAEFAASLAIKSAPQEPQLAHGILNDPDLKARLLLIESRLAQAKDVAAETERLQQSLMHRYAPLPLHGQALLYMGEKLALLLPAAARAFVADGRVIHAIAEPDRVTPSPFEIAACQALADDACLADVAVRAEQRLTDRRQSWEWEEVASAYALAGDFASARRLLQGFDSGDCFQFTTFDALQRAFQDANFDEANRWLSAWLACQWEFEPNFNTGFGVGGNRWARLSNAYTRLAKEFLGRGHQAQAVQAARAAFGLAIEADVTWNERWLWFRAADLGSAYGGALGVLLTAEEGS